MPHAAAADEILRGPPYRAAKSLPMISRPGNVLDAIDSIVLAQLSRSFVAINSDLVLRSPSPQTLDHNAVSAAQRNGRRDDGVRNPMNVHRGDST